MFPLHIKLLESFNLIDVNFKITFFKIGEKSKNNNLSVIIIFMCFFGLKSFRKPPSVDYKEILYLRKLSHDFKVYFSLKKL